MNNELTETITWIPVAERLPENEREVLTRSPASAAALEARKQAPWFGGNVFPGRYRPGEFVCWDAYDDYPLDGVTHWAEMPKGPRAWRKLARRLRWGEGEGMTDDERAALNAERYGEKPKPPPLASEMTLRDYFAACALIAFNDIEEYLWAEVAQDAFALADAMMAERDKR